VVLSHLSSYPASGDGKAGVQRIKQQIPITLGQIRQSTVKQFALNFHDGSINPRICYNEEDDRNSYCHKYVDTPRLLCR
jgi:hypothetical protein